MPGLTLVTGGPASGKTERLLEVIAARYRADPFAATLVVVPTARHADQLRQRVVARVGIAVGLDVTTLRLLAARLTADAPIPPPEVARELLVRTAVDRAARDGPARRFGQIAHARGFHSLLTTAVGALASAAVDAPRLAAHAAAVGDADLAATADVYGGYLDALDARGWHPPEARARLAARALDRHPLPPLVVVDGAQFLEPGEAELVAAIAARTETWLALDPGAGERARWTLEALRRLVPDARLESLPERPPDDTFEAYSAADDEAQLREIARAVKQRLAADPTLRPSDVAVTVRRVGPYLAAARRVFREFDLPLDPAAGEPLAERPFGVWALRLLRLSTHGWRLLDALDAFAAGFFAAGRVGLRPGDLERLRRLGRRHALWSGLDTLRRLPEAARSETDDAGAPNDRLVAAAEACAALLDRLEPLLDAAARRAPGTHAAMLDTALFGADALVDSALERDPSFAVEVAALRGALDATRAVDEALGAEAVSFASFVDHLERAMERPTTLIREAGGVLLAPMHTLHGLRFRQLYVAGLGEGEFPAPTLQAGLLTADTRRALADAGFVLPPEARATEDELWDVAITRAGATSLWHARYDGRGRPVAPSYYLQATGVPVEPLPVAPPPEVTASLRELALSLTRRWPAEARRPAALPAWDLVVCVAAPVEQRRRSFATAGRFEGAIPGIATAGLVNAGVLWSASRLESYRTCPFQFFSRYGLRLFELDEEQLEADAATRGTVMHAMLEDALAPLVETGRPLDDAGLEDARARLRSGGREIWDEAPRRYAFGREALWRHQADDALRRLERLLRREAAHHQRLEMTSVEGTERVLTGTLPGIEPPLLLQARIDRVDRGDGVLEVVDYKTGQFISRNALAPAGERLQLQLYALVAGQALDARRLLARYAFLREPKTEWYLDSQRPDDAAVLETAADVAAAVRDDVAAGHFEVGPRPPECPRYCAVITICRVNQFSRSKSWR